MTAKSCASESEALKKQVGMDTNDKTVLMRKIKAIPGTVTPHPWAYYAHFTKSELLSAGTVVNGEALASANPNLSDLGSCQHGIQLFFLGL